MKFRQYYYYFLTYIFYKMASFFIKLSRRASDRVHIDFSPRGKKSSYEKMMKLKDRLQEKHPETKAGSLFYDMGNTLEKKRAG